jgi:hypothetical protein
MSKQPQQQQQQQDEDDPLKLYTVDLTERAATGKLDPVIGREAETRAVTQTLLRKSKNNPVLIAQPGKRSFHFFFVFLQIYEKSEIYEIFNFQVSEKRRWSRNWRSASLTVTCLTR